MSEGAGSKSAVGRPVGARDVRYDERRLALAEKALGAVLREGARTTLHDLSRETGSSIPTLKHYFGSRSGVVAAALRSVTTNAAPYLAQIAEPPLIPLEASISEVARNLVAAWESAGVGEVFSKGLVAGMLDEQAGPGYLDGILEPTLQAFERRLRGHAERGELDVEADDEMALRAAGLAFLAPLLLALIHQHGLSGTRCRPLDVKRFVELHVARFVRAYGVP